MILLYPFEPSLYGLLITVIRRDVEPRSLQFIRKILLLDKMAFIIVGILVIDTAAEVLGAEVAGDIAEILGFDQEVA